MLKAITAIIVIIFIICWILVYKFNNMCIFHPSKYVDMKVIDNAYNNLDITREYHKIQSGKFDIYCLDMIKPNTETIFIFSHGNAGNLTNFLNSKTVSNLLNVGSVVLYDYRGYGDSTGMPTQDGIHEDLKAVYRYVGLTYPGKRIVLYGFSLGSYPTLRVSVSEKGIDHVIIEGAFVSVRYMADVLYGKHARYVKWLVIDNYDNLGLIGMVRDTGKVTIVHSIVDDIVPYCNAVELKRVKGVRLIDVDGGHNDPVYGSEYMGFIGGFGKG